MILLVGMLSLSVACGDDGDSNGDNANAQNNDTGNNDVNNAGNNDTNNAGNNDVNNDMNNDVNNDGNNDVNNDPPPPIFGTEADIAMAMDLWMEIEDHQLDWMQPAATAGWVEGAMPHGSFQQFYHNGTDNTADGYIVIKRNYGMMDEEALGALTVMKKVEGFDSEINDWFFAKFLPDGSLDVNGNGVALAGRVGKGGDMGCVPCHSGAENGNFLHTFEDGEVPSAPPFGRPMDEMLAAQLWDEIGDRANWDAPEGREDWVEGAMPHGSFQRYYHNGTDTGADGYIIVKENYGMMDENALGALTVMKRMEGFDEDLNDWFFAKFLPDGSLDVNGDGVTLAGRVGKGGDMGCVPCHSGAPGGDFLFTVE